MWSTPAPPSTARVAASIWSGTGEVKTWPAAAASSMPRPTNPPWSGSWPEPPPEINATLPGFGPPLRRTRFWARSTLTMSGCAASSPDRLSGTMSSTALMSFFTRLGAFVAMGSSWESGCVTGWTGGSSSCGLVGMLGDRGTRHRGRTRVADELVREGADGATDDRSRDVDREQGAEVRLGADEQLEELRADLAGRVERRARDRADEDDDPVDDEADDDPGKARGC